MKNGIQKQLFQRIKKVKRMLLNSDMATLKYSHFRELQKMPDFFKKSPLSGAEKHPDFQVTSCHHFVTTNVDFAYTESE